MRRILLMPLLLAVASCSSEDEPTSKADDPPASSTTAADLRTVDEVAAAACTSDYEINTASDTATCDSPVYGVHMFDADERATELAAIEDGTITGPCLVGANWAVCPSPLGDFTRDGWVDLVLEPTRDELGGEIVGGYSPS